MIINKTIKASVCLALVFFVFLGQSRSNTYSKTIDSLESCISKANPKAKVDIYNELSVLLKDIDLSKSLNYAQKAKSLAQSIQYKTGYADAMVNIAMGIPNEMSKANINQLDILFGEAVRIYRNYAEHRKAANALIAFANITRDLHYINKAYNLILEAYNIFEYIGDIEGTARCFYLFGRIYERVEYYEAAIEFANKSLQLYRETGNKPDMAECYMLIAEINTKSLTNKELILGNLNSALRLFYEYGSKGSLAACYKSMAAYYTDIQIDFDSAKYYLEKGMELAKQQNNPQLYSALITHLGHIYAKVKGDYETDLKYNLEAIEIRKKTNLLLTLSSSYLNAGYDLIKLKRYEEADSKLKAGLELAKEWGSLIYTRRAYNLLFELSEAKGDLQNAIVYLRNAKVYSDSIYAAEATNKTNLMKQLSETMRKDKRILELENKESKNFILYISIMSLIILASAVSFYFLYLGKKKDNLLLLKQKEMIESRDELIYHLNDVNPLPIFIFDLNSSTIVYQNNSFVKFFGPARIYKYSKKVFLYMRDLYPDDARTIFSFIKSGTFLAEALKGLSVRIKNHENAWKWVFIRSIAFGTNEKNQPTSLLSIIIDISSQKAYEQSILIRSEKTRLINEFAIEMASIEKNNDIHLVMAEWLRKFTKAIGVSVSIYNSRMNWLEVKAVSTGSRLVDQFNKIIDNDIFKIKFVLTDEAKNKMLRESVRSSVDITDFTHGSISPVVSGLIKKTFGISYFTGITLSYGNEIYGTALLFMPPKENSIDDDILKTIATIAAVAIKKRIAEEELVASEQRYRELVDNSLVGIFITIDNKITFCNNRLMGMFGYDGYFDIIGKDAAELICNNEQAEFMDLRLSVESQRKGEFIKKFRGVRKNGSDIYLNLICNRIDYLGKTGIQFLVMDISDKMLAEKAINDLELEFETVIDTSPDGILLLDLEGNILTGNKKTLELFSVDGSQLIGKSIAGFIKDETINQASIGKLIDKLLGKHITEVEFIISGGKMFLGEITTSVIKDSTGQPKSIICMIRDITERKQSETLLQNVSRLHSIGTLAGGIAHNLKNMLTSMLLNVGLARAKPEKTEKYLNNISKAIDQANALATKFQTFTIGGEIQKSTINVNRVIDDAVSVALSGSNIICRTAYSQDELLVDADPKQLNEVFTNLLINAKQAMNFSGKIYIETDIALHSKSNALKLAEGEYIRMSFKDQGIGIPPENLSKVFDPFFTTKSDGFGLGLSSVYYIIQNHKGNIVVQSEPGSGTEFTIYLPVSKKSKPDTAETKTDLYFGNNQRILVMDDDDDIRESLMEIFSVLNYSPVFTKNGVEALDIYKKTYNTNSEIFSAVILDLTIRGGESGEIILEKMKKINPEVKAIVFSGHSFTQVLANYRDYGFVSILNKPVTIQEISRVLRDVLG